jgi:hypothetical protein
VFNWPRRPGDALKNDLPAFNGGTSWPLPMPARYVIGEDGTILYAEESRLHAPPGTGRHTAGAAPGDHEPRRVRSIE